MTWCRSRSTFAFYQLPVLCHLWLRLLRRSMSLHGSPSEETTSYQGICAGLLYGLLRLQQSLDSVDPDRQGHPPQATLTLARVSRTGLIPGLLRSSLLLPETLSLDCDSAFMQALGEGVWKASLTGNTQTASGYGVAHSRPVLPRTQGTCSKDWSATLGPATQRGA